ncbi:MAG TPA: UvrD-helicase domain-containing protein [Solirubrobacteraceae bacterium]|nr:UvrD-helicase domain-containing protein [Solirubrobacteraceae bacterium]
MAANPHAAHLQELLEGLNEPQREAVTHGEGPLLILAGAGSGKTRVLTHRIAFLIYTDQAQTGEILAITFTNKAAREMRERVERLLGRSARGMWVMTFHAACARILRAEAARLGYTRQFTIYDQADARRLAKRSADAVGVDPKRYTPSAVLNQISAAKNKLIDAETYQQQVGSPFEEMIAEVYSVYERDLLRMNAMDFDDLLFRTVNLLELFGEVRERYSETFRHVLVDEYQDTNHAQYRLLQLLVGGGPPPKRGGEVPGDRPTYAGPVGHRNLAVVGDDAQCLPAGSLVTMADGSEKPIESVTAGDLVRSCYGSGDLRAARVLRTHRSRRDTAVAIRLASGRRIVSTPEHTHFAGYRVGSTPQMHMTYVMQHREKGFRVGTSRTYTAGQPRSVVGVQMRTTAESADAAWIVGLHPSDAEARAQEAVLSLQYGLPTLPFRARRRGVDNGLVCDQELIDDVFASIDSVGGGHALLADEGLDPDWPHFFPRSHEGHRRVLTVTLCADRRGSTPMHLVALGGRDAETRASLEGIGLSVRPAKAGSMSWRYESVFKDFGAVMKLVEQISATVPVRVRLQARLGAPGDQRERNTLPFLPADSVRPGMVMFNDLCQPDLVRSVELIPLDVDVFDIDVEGTHNFIADGVITHNSIYGFRGADIRNILDFQQDFEDARVVKLEQNYRSTETILQAANSVIVNNRGGIAKRLWSENGQGDQIQLRAMSDEHAEARYVIGEIQRLVDEGASRSEIAVLYRTNAMSRVLEDALVRADISYQVIGGTKFYERAEIKDAIAYLTLLANPYDVVSFTRVANSPRRGIGQTSLARITSHATAMDISVWEAAAAPRQVPGLGAAAIKALDRFMTTMAELRAMTGAEPLGGEDREEGEDQASQLSAIAPGDVPEVGLEPASIAELMEAVLAQTGYVEALEAERSIEAQGRIENLEQLVEVGREFDAAAEGDGTLERFLQEVALVADADTRADDEGLVTLMTLHNAKGLEYPTVFITGLEDGVFPHSRAVDEGGLEEERRLFYVGVTRAMRHLYLTYARRRAVFGAQSYGLPSRFLAEIPGDLLEEGGDAGFRPGAIMTPSLARGAGSATSWGSAPSRVQPRPQDEIQAFRLGEDVVHAAFGEGVVTGVEPDGVIVVRFAGDGTERKLMAEYAPVSKR